MYLLEDCTVLYTRAAAHFPAFAAKIHALGGIAEHLPLVDTRRIALDADSADYCRQADMLIFTSAAAVEHFPRELWRRQRNIAIGPATAAAVEAKQQALHLAAPPPFNSESLLSIFQPQEQNIAIIAARGGRQLLHEQLNRHNRARFAFVYERYNPSPHWCADLSIPQALILSSQAALNHLIEITAQATLNLLQSRTAVIALSPRIGQAAQGAGFQQVFAAAQADENAQIQQLCQWWQTIKEY